MARRVLITGGAGFIGERLARALAPRAEAVVIFDSLHRQVHGDDPKAPPLPPKTTFVRGDVRDRTAVHQVVAAANADLICHLAAETGTGQSYDEPARYCEVNVTGTAHLIEAVREHAAKPPRLILAGSRAIYGEGAYRTRDGRVIVGPVRTVEAMQGGRFDPVDADGGPLVPLATEECSPPAPASVYASTKLMQEDLLTQCAQGGAYEPVILRFQNVYGPGQSLKNPYTGVLSIFAAQILQGRRLNIFEDGGIVRDFVYVDDVVAAVVLAAELPAEPKGAVNIGSGERTTIRECAEILLRHLGADPKNYDVTGDFRAGDVRHALADITRARQELGWEPKTALSDGLKALAEWVRQEAAAGPPDQTPAVPK